MATVSQDGSLLSHMRSALAVSVLETSSDTRVDEFSADDPQADSTKAIINSKVCTANFILSFDSEQIHSKRFTRHQLLPI
jgi:hypothetical protein